MVCLAVKDAAARRDESKTFVILVLALTGTGLLVALGVEFVLIQDDIGRMNTLFKFYIQVWALLALASACILWRLGDRGLFRIKGMTLVRGVWLVASGNFGRLQFLLHHTGDRRQAVNKVRYQQLHLGRSPVHDHNHPHRLDKGSTSGA